MTVVRWTWRSKFIHFLKDPNHILPNDLKFFKALFLETNQPMVEQQSKNKDPRAGQNIRRLSNSDAIWAGKTCLRRNRGCLNTAVKVAKNRQAVPMHTCTFQSGGAKEYLWSGAETFGWSRSRTFGSPLAPTFWLKKLFTIIIGNRRFEVERIVHSPLWLLTH